MEQRKTAETLRILFCIVMCIAMVMTAELTRQKEILFPEIAALVTGAWAAEKQFWKTNKVQMVVLMTISACAGAALVRYMDTGLYEKLLLGYGFAGLCLSLAGSGLAPMISACILPVMMGEGSLLYPVSVFVMTCIIALGQKLMERHCLREETVYEPVRKHAGKWLVYWALRTLVLAILIIIPVLLEQPFFIAPPLLVLFTEFSEPESPARKAPVKIWLVTVGAAFVGSLGRLFLCSLIGLPFTVAAVFGVSVTFLLFRLAGKMFPPAAALSLLPLILPEKSLLLYGAEVSAGAAVLILAATECFPKKEKRE